MGDNDITSSFFEKLLQNLDDFQSTVETMLTSYNDSVNFYSDLMRNELNKAELYEIHDVFVTPNSLKQTHQNAKKEAITQV